MGGDEYDEILQALTNHPKEVPEVMICSQDSMKVLEDQFNSQNNHSRKNHGYAGIFLTTPVWIDNRFEQPILVSGYE